MRWTETSCYLMVCIYLASVVGVAVMGISIHMPSNERRSNFQSSEHHSSFYTTSLILRVCLEIEIQRLLSSNDSSVYFCYPNGCFSKFYCRRRGCFSPSVNDLKRRMLKVTLEGFENRLD